MSFIKALACIAEEHTEKALSILKHAIYELDDVQKCKLLHYSVGCYNQIVTQYLLNHGINVNAKDSSGTTVLMKAVRSRHIEMTQVLLLAGADMMMLNNENESALNMVYYEIYFLPHISELFFTMLCKKYSTNEKRVQILIDAGCHLYQAVYLSDIEVVEDMLKQRLSVYSMHPTNKQTALHIAVALKKGNIVKLLLKFGSIEDDEVKAFSSPIREQINEKRRLIIKNEKITRCLLAKNGYVNVQDCLGNTPIMIAVEKEDEEIIRMLLAAGANVMMLNNNNQSALHIVCKQCYFTPDIGELFFAELCKIYSTDKERAQSLIDAGFHLYQACCFSNVKIVQYMLERGFPVNSTLPSSKLSALHIAVSLEDADIVELLLKNGANINALDINGSTPLHFIYGSRHQYTCEKIEILKHFLNQEQVSLTSCDSEGLFQIGLTLARGTREAISLVLLSNIDFTAKDQDNESSILHYIAMNTNSKVVEELKCHVNKFDFNVLDRTGKSPLHLAVARGNVDMTQFLLAQGANPNCVQNQYHYTPLYYAYSPFEPAVEKQCYQNIELLLQHDADTQVVFTDENNKKLTLFDIAKNTNRLSQLKPFIAQLVVHKQLGVPVTDIISTKINSCSLLKQYCNRCQKLIRKRISGSVTLFKLLISDRKKMARYSGNKKLMLKLIRLSYKQDLMFYYPYYCNTLKKNVLNGIQHRLFLVKIAEVICIISEDRFDITHLIVNKIIDFLDEESLNQLYQLYRLM